MARSTRSSDWGFPRWRSYGAEREAVKVRLCDRHGCEEPGDRHYNRPIRVARDHKGDRLQRADHLYDFIVEIDHNTRPRVAGRGSAVFLHLARDNFGPTAGCVSMTRSAMLHLLRRLGPRTKIIIG